MVYPTVWRSRTPNVWSEIDQIFGRRLPNGASTVWTPVVDVRESEDQLLMQAELPGLDSKNINVSVENNVLTISGEKGQSWENGSEDAQVHVFERHYGRFERSFRLPKTVDAEQIDARYKDGVLSVSLPKVEAAKPRKIEVKIK
jgi:HSP20 family protein